MSKLQKLLDPSSVVVIGASSDHASVRGHCCETILRHGYQGDLHFVSRSVPKVFGRPTLASLDDVTGTPDLALLLTPANVSAAVLDQCGKRGIGAAIAVASGFAEEGSDEGRARQDDIAAVARRHGIALSGPNGEGFVDYVTGLAATFSPVLRDANPIEVGDIESGDVTVIAQSGAIGFGLADLALARGVLLDRIITTGNEAGLSLTDYLEHVLVEGRARSVLLFVEGLRDGARFLDLARHAREKGIGITVLRVGKSETGKRQAASHTGALASDDRLTRDLLRHAGVVDAADPTEAVECAALLAGIARRPMSGFGIGICSSTGGGAGLLADACENAGLAIPSLSETTRTALDAALPSYASSVNPVDATAGGIRAMGYTQLARIVAQDPAIDAVVVAASGRTVATLGREADALKTLAKEVKKPVVFWSYTSPGGSYLTLLEQAGLPSAVNPNAVAQALESRARASVVRGRQLSSDIEVKGVLTEAQVYPLLEAEGLSAGTWRLCATPRQAAEFAAGLSHTVAVKIQSPDILHKTDAGGVVLDVEAEAVAATSAQIIKAAKTNFPDARIDGLLVQEMAAPGVEIIIGGFRDPSFGPVVMVGLGGVLTEMLGDVVFAAAPVEDAAAASILGQLKGRKILAGARGKPPVDQAALSKAVAVVSRLVASPGIREIDLNPVFAHEHGLTVADALIVSENAP